MVEIARHGGNDLYDLQQFKKCKQKPEIVLDNGDIEYSEVERLKKVTNTGGCLAFNQKALQRYILHCAQNLESGGMRG